MYNFLLIVFYMIIIDINVFKMAYKFNFFYLQICQVKILQAQYKVTPLCNKNMCKTLS